MPPLTEARKQEILTAIQANRVPTRGASNQTFLVTGAGATRRHNRYIVLADGAGKLTEAGGTSVAPGSTITITVGRAEAPPPETTVP